MKTFTDRVNASLPIDEADYILLRLVQGQQERVCGAPCPAAQIMSEDGRCVPSALVAQAGRKPALPATTSASSEKPAVLISSWKTTTTAEAAKLPLPGGELRMALAGPKSEQQAAARLRSDDDGSAAAAGRLPQAKRDRAAGGGDWRRSRSASADNRARKSASSGRRKFGPWIFTDPARLNY